jgi:hypothetical protein
MSNLLKVSLRQQAVFIPESALVDKEQKLRETTGLLVKYLSKSGYAVSEKLLQSLNNILPAQLLAIKEEMQQALGLKNNWTPLVKAWDNPTGESFVDHLMTWIATIFESKGTKLSCGHIIPADTFPLERYNGCPFCGTPFATNEFTWVKQGSQIKVLELWTASDINNYFVDLLTSRTALDATQMDSLKILLQELPLPEVEIKMKETAMAVIDILIMQEKEEVLLKWFSSPVDILRYLWYKHTGFLQIVEPKTILKRNANNNRHITVGLDRSAVAKILSKSALKLKYTRRECARVAGWINNLEMDAEKICEQMHPKRNMWVRFIRALRLAEYSKRNGYEKLRLVLDKFYNEDYPVWQGKVEQYRLRYDVEATVKLLKQRPGLFARSLFANMLWFGSEAIIPAFKEIIDKVPARLVLTLDMYADNYFDKHGSRVVKPLGGVSKNIAQNHLIDIYEEEQLKEMRDAVRSLCIEMMKRRFEAIVTSNKTMYIDPLLYKIPLPIGDRGEAVQDLSAVLMGTRFPVEGDKVRLFMQWGSGLPAQHMDMDLSCHIAYDGRTEMCSFSQLVATGCKHSGDIRSIPSMTGTAEYIDVDTKALQNAGAKYVVFACNAYSNGSITPNLVVGWMNSKHEMKISESTGVAYDPSCVQHQVRIVNAVTKGLAFGVLDLASNEIIWLEMPFQGQLVQHLNTRTIEALVRKLGNKLTIGCLLSAKADAQRLTIVDSEHADEVYSRAWGANTAAVTRLFID